MGHTPMDAMPTWLSSGGVDVLASTCFSQFFLFYLFLYGECTDHPLCEKTFGEVSILSIFNFQVSSRL